jgi:DNA-binding NarL/FixJ family response regulator
MWAACREQPISWNEDIAPIEHFIVAGAEGWLSARASDEILPTPFKLPIGLMTGAAEIDEPVLGAARCLAARVQAPRHAPISDLSSRERTIARLLVRGYGTANVAALTDLTEHTVRTYVRRVYKKLGVSNRADLVRRLLVT